MVAVWLRYLFLLGAVRQTAPITVHKYRISLSSTVGNFALLISESLTNGYELSVQYTLPTIICNFYQIK